MLNSYQSLTHINLQAIKKIYVSTKNKRAQKYEKMKG